MSGSRYHGVSLLHGWLPVGVQVLAGLVLAASMLWLAVRGDRRRLRWLVPGMTVAGLAAVGIARWRLGDQDLAADPAPWSMWLWIGLTGAAGAALLGARVRPGRWWRAGATASVLLALLCVGVQANSWVGYLPTVTEAYDQLTAAPMPDQTALDQLPALRGTPMTTGKLVAITTPDDLSHFSHRTEYVYLPPAWFAADQPPLPAVMMIGGEFSTPTDWIRTGRAVQTADRYAQAHHGVAPVLVFADSTGSFDNDTECVDGPRGNAAQHLTEELRPYVIDRFHTAASAQQWAVVGWSTGGTCAVDLAVTHPELFSTFDDIQGDLSPNAGDTQQTITDLYGGNARAFAAFDPTTVLAGHADYPDSAGWFDNAPAHATAQHRAAKPAPAADADGTHAGYGGQKDPAPPSMQGQQAAEAAALCARATAKDISCSLHTQPGKHTWQFAGTAFSDALPWLTTRLTAPAGPVRATV
jgi:S-formylglutathione hydrolase FrmB